MLFSKEVAPTEAAVHPRVQIDYSIPHGKDTNPILVMHKATTGLVSKHYTH